MSNFTLVIHGGAGTILKEDMTPALEQAYSIALKSALDAGYEQKKPLKLFVIILILT